MSENQYNAPAMEVVEFGKEDMFCGTTLSNVDGGPDGPTGPITPYPGGGVES